MAATVNFEASNTADFIFEISAVDADTGVDIDFTTALATFTVLDESGGQVLTGTITDGHITVVTTVMTVKFTATEMSALNSGSYSVGCVYQIAGVTSPLFTGTLSVYDGIASI